MRYLFCDFELDGDRLLLLRDGRPLRVEPRVLELLVYLLANRHRLVDRDELVEELWEGRAVTDGALSRCLYQARKALGDSSQQQRFLRTVHGRGLRFAKDVEVTELAAGQPSAGAPAGGEGSDAPAPGAGRSGRSGGHGRRTRAATVAVLAAAAVAVAAVVAASLLTARMETAGDAAAPAAGAAPPAAAGAPSSRGESDRAGSDRPILALLPLSVHRDQAGAAAEKELELLATSLSELLHIRLGSLPGVRLRPLVAARDEANTAASLRQLAGRVGATHVISGSLRPAGGERAEVDLTLFEIRSDLPARRMPLGSYAVPRLRRPADFEELIRVRKAIARRTARLIGSPFDFEDPEPGGTPDPEAWRLYVLAYQRLSDDFCAGSAPAGELLRRALERDPEFGLAWEALGTSYYNRVWACGEHASLYEQAFAALDRAVAVAPGLPFPRFTKITLLIETGRVEEAYELVLGEAESGPDDPLTLNATSYALRYAGYLEASAAALDRLLERDPLVFAVGTLGGSPNTYLYQGRLERFLDVVPLSEMAYHRWYRGFAELLRDRPGAARAALEPAFRSSPSQIFGRLAHALLAVLDGDPAAARAIVGEISRQRDAMDNVDAEITLKQAQILALAGDREGALEELDKTVAQGFFCPPCLDRDPSLAALRSSPRWRAIMARATRRHVAFGERFGLVPARD